MMTILRAGPFLIAALPLLLGACVSERSRVAEKEQMLAAAGFREEPADTPERQAQLATLPPHRLLTQSLRTGGREQPGYVYADPDVCHCVWLGNAQAYSAFQQLAFQQRIANEEQQAAELNQQTFDWGLWGPELWGPPPIIVVHRGPR